MTPAKVVELHPDPNQPSLRPEKNSFDSAYEHSLDRWLAVRRMVEEDEGTVQPLCQFYALAGGS